ncbi:MOSC domain-containing protein [Gordonia alkaliphila]|uniref:MOSC domain-containing protein n=1 Tax=Gordonia alkaliphila TaxID=1053547 RepID=A0ABP8ZE88_9ACTN|nr:MOSC domain-containing protein [Gordonia alkaliphila]MCK0437908.1 MOSC domain-containing protein [Gordonia alkaliphila]
MKFDKSARVLDVCVVHQLLPDPGKVGVTAIDKRPVEGPVSVGPYGLYADVQADRKYHGGLDQAIYAYAAEDADYWENELGRPTPAGWYGENLRVEGVDLTGAGVGEQWQIGEKLVVEVTSPRIPCQTFARRVGGEEERGWVRRFMQAGRPGLYLRVVTRGAVEAGDPIVVLSSPSSSPTIGDVFARRS